MSHHPESLSRVLRPVLVDLEARARFNPPRIYAPALYFGCLTAPMGVRVMVAGIAECALRGRVFSPSQARLGELYHRDRRTISRWVQHATRCGWIRVLRRGKKLTNVYRLARYLWRRLTGQFRQRPPTREQQQLLDLFRRIERIRPELRGGRADPNRQLPPGGTP